MKAPPAVALTKHGVAGGSAGAHVDPRQPAARVRAAQSCSTTGHCRACARRLWRRTGPPRPFFIASARAPARGGARSARGRGADAAAKRGRTPNACAHLQPARPGVSAPQGRASCARRRLAGRRKLLQKQRGAAAGPRCARSAVRRPAGARRGSGPGLRDRHADDAVKHGTRTAARLTDMASTRKPANKLFVHDD